MPENHSTDQSHNGFLFAPEPDEKKQCPHCGKLLLLREFNKNSLLADGLDRRCRECMRAHSADQRVKRSANGKTRAYNHRRAVYLWGATLKRKYGLSVEEYERMAREQDNRCAICRRPETSMFKGKRRRLAVDHDHATGQVRCLLCKSCNVAIGTLSESPKIMRAAIRYLHRWVRDGHRISDA